jgi:hypothetical protein
MSIAAASETMFSNMSVQELPFPWRLKGKASYPEMRKIWLIFQKATYASQYNKRLIRSSPQ